MATPGQKFQPLLVGSS